MIAPIDERRGKLLLSEILECYKDYGMLRNNFVI